MKMRKKIRDKIDSLLILFSGFSLIVVNTLYWIFLYGFSYNFKVSSPYVFIPLFILSLICLIGVYRLFLFWHRYDKKWWVILLLLISYFYYMPFYYLRMKKLQGR